MSKTKAKADEPVTDEAKTSPAKADPVRYRVCVPMAPVVDKRGVQLVDEAGEPRFEPLAGFDGIHYPTDAEVIARIQAGEKVPMEDRGPIKTVRPGHIARDIPEVSVPWLLEQKIIEEVVDEDDGASQGAATDGGD